MGKRRSKISARKDYPDYYGVYTFVGKLNKEYIETQIDTDLGITYSCTENMKEYSSWKARKFKCGTKSHIRRVKKGISRFKKYYINMKSLKKIHTSSYGNYPRSSYWRYYNYYRDYRFVVVSLLLIMTWADLDYGMR